MKSLKLGGKIGGGFGLLILIALVLGGLAVWNMSAAARNSRTLAQEYIPEVVVASDIERNYQLFMFDMRGYAMSGRRELYDLAQGHAKRVKKALEDAKELAAKSEHLATLRDTANNLTATLNQYEGLVAKTVDVDAAIDASRDRMDANATQFIDNAYGFQKSQIQKLDGETGAVDAARLRERQRKVNVINDVIDLGNFIRIANFKGQAARDTKMVREATGNFDKIRKLIEDIRPLVHQERNLQELANVDKAAGAYRLAIEEYLKNWEALQDLTRQRERVANQLVALVQQVSQAGIDNTRRLSLEAESSLTMSNWVMVAGLVVALLLGVVVALLITRSIVNPVRATVDAVGQAAKGDFSFSVDQKMLSRGDELGDMLRDVDKMAENLSVVVTESTAAAETVATSAGEISQGNQDLSERTQQQASAIEETASSIEEMTSSVKQNAGNSQQANELARRTATMAVQGGEVVQRTVGAMAAVTESSKKISDIINVVNEIAFQTNLLALNAAVEAARAGEAGRGFAVVAGEVRNLAGRSAAAAKEIQALITDSVAKVEQGNELVAESGVLLKEIIGNVQNVADTVAEITAASQEQASGIDEINRAVTQMDEAVQQNAALVEEAASASENMAAAAEQLRSQMRQFKVRQLSGGAGGGGWDAPSAAAPAPRPAAKPAARPAPKPAARPAPKPAARPAPKPADKTPAKGGKDDFFDNADLEGFEEF